jgi:hypothetical protein
MITLGRDDARCAKMRAHHALAARASLPSLRALVSLRRAATSRPLATRTSSTMAQATPKLKLIYFPVKARAEPTRLALHIAGIPFQDVRIQHADWPAMKEKMPFHTLPVNASMLLCAPDAPTTRTGCARSLITARAHTYIVRRCSRLMASSWGRATPSSCTRGAWQSWCQRTRSRRRRHVATIASHHIIRR